MANQPGNGKEPFLRPQLRRGPASPGKIEKARDARRALRRLLPYLKPYLLTIAAVFALMLVAILMDLIGPYLMGVAIDRYISGKDISGLVRTALFMLGVFLTGGAMQASADWIMARVSQSALRRLRQDLFNHLQDLSLRFYDQQPAGELMSRLTNDIDAINQAVSQNITTLAAGLLTLGGILIAMFALNPWLALAALAIVPLTFWFTSFVARYTRRGYRTLQKELGELNANMEESISGQRVISAFRRKEAAVEQFSSHNQAVYRAGV
jgi:ATP-binding cassette subfamily B protein